MKKQFWIISDLEKKNFKEHTVKFVVILLIMILVPMACFIAMSEIPVMTLKDISPFVDEKEANIATFYGKDLYEAPTDFTHIKDAMLYIEMKAFYGYSEAEVDEITSQPGFAATVLHSKDTNKLTANDYLSFSMMMVLIKYLIVILIPFISVLVILICLAKKAWLGFFKVIPKLVDAVVALMLVWQIAAWIPYYSVMKNFFDVPNMLKLSMNAAQYVLWALSLLSVIVCTALINKAWSKDYANNEKGAAKAN